MICSISDVHIKSPGDERSILFEKFLDSTQVEESKYIFLLGDIFDLMVGCHDQYLNLYKSIFENLSQLALSGKKIYFLEGNHDFHLGELMSKFVLKYGLGSAFFHSEEALQLTIRGRDVYLCHGDDIEIDNPKYKAYRTLIRSSQVQFLANKIVPYHVVELVGTVASSQSRKKNNMRYDLSDDKVISDIREKFRMSAKIVKSMNPDVELLLSGHSHVIDHFEQEGFEYLNNGYFPKEKSFIYIDEAFNASFVKLD